MATCNLSSLRVRTVGRIRNPERYARIAALIEQFDTFERQYKHTISRSYWNGWCNARPFLQSALKAARAGHRTRADTHLRNALRRMKQANQALRTNQAIDKLATLAAA
jgi:hypothetical protein